jgi:hypothetical protein
LWFAPTVRGATQLFQQQAAAAAAAAAAASLVVLVHNNHFSVNVNGSAATVNNSASTVGRVQPLAVAHRTGALELEQTMMH